MSKRYEKTFVMSRSFEKIHLVSRITPIQIFPLIGQYAQCQYGLYVTVIPKEQNYSSWSLCDSFSIEANLASGNLRVSMGIAESFRVVVVREDDRLTLEFSRCIMFEMC